MKARNFLFSLLLFGNLCHGLNIETKKDKTKKQIISSVYIANKENYAPNQPRTKEKPRLAIKSKEILTSILDLDQKALLANPGTTFIFIDIDETIMRKHLFFYLSPEDQMDLLERAALEELKDHSCKQFIEFETFLRGKEKDRVLLEDRVVGLLHELGKNAVIIGLTSRLPKFADRTHHTLNELGVNFASLSKVGHLKFCNVGGEILKDGIFYTGNKQKKVNYIPPIIAYVRSKLTLLPPYDAFHIDDNDKEIAAYQPASVTVYPLDYPLSIKPYHFVACRRMIGNLDSVYQELINKLFNELFMGNIAQ